VCPHEDFGVFGFAFAMLAFPWVTQKARQPTDPRQIAEPAGLAEQTVASGCRTTQASARGGWRPFLSRGGLATPQSRQHVVASAISKADV
jgi:hypothetical protein